MTFFETIEKSKENDVMRCIDYPMQNIVNNGDYTFMWENDWKVVKLTGEFIGMNWEIIKQ